MIERRFAPLRTVGKIPSGLVIRDTNQHEVSPAWAH
jgi:hypothetical protein